MEEIAEANAALVDSAALSNMMECIFGIHPSSSTVKVPIYYRTECIIDWNNCVTMNILTHLEVIVRAPKSMIKPFFLYKKHKNKPEFKLIWAPLHWYDRSPPVFCTRKNIQAQLLTSHLEDNEHHIACSVEHSVF